MPKPEIYVIGKYTDDTIEDERANERAAKNTAHRLAVIGYKPFCPHTAFGLGTPTELKQNDDIDLTQEDIMVSCLNRLSTCDCIFLQNGWRRSSGSLREYNYAQSMRMPTIRDYDEAKHYLECVHFARHRRI